MSKLESKPVAHHSHVRELVCVAVDTDSRRWPAGTTFVPVSAGYNAILHRDEQVVRIDGEEVVF